MIKRVTSVLIILIAFLLGMFISRYAPFPQLSDLNPQAALATAAATGAATSGATKAPAGAATGAATKAPAGAVTSAATGPATVRATSTPSATRPSATPSPLATLTPSRTLLPPPTFEPPTNTPLPSPLPTTTATFTPFALAPVPGLVGGETSTPISTPGCIPRKDWKLTYEVKANDALINIANTYNTTPDEIVKANCLSDKNKIFVGQTLKVPGTAQPNQPAYQCIPLQNLTPQNGTLAVPGSGSLVFHWYGPRVPRNLIRVFAPDGTKLEYVIELRQDNTIDLMTIKQAGTYTWYVYPLDANFVQTCPEGGPWTFTKAQAPTSTPTVAAVGTTIAR